MAEVEVDVNKIAGHAAAELIESFFSAVKGESKEQIAKYKVRFGRGFSKYLTEAAERYGQYKTLLNRYESISLAENYVPARVRMSDDILRVEDFFDRLNDKKTIIVEGTAGLGKTLFIRYMLQYIVQYETRYIPILFELRHLHLDNSGSLLAKLTEQVSAHVTGFTEEHLVFGLSKGKFAILLDGLDELAVVDRTRYATEILELSYRYRDTPLLISSRPDDMYLPWEQFVVARLQPMSRDQTNLMLGKLKFDQKIKESFLSANTPDFFERHREFLSIPLLATLMMMTYEEFATVPSKVHIFYEQAYQTLFNKHDFIKGAYSRKIETGLDVELFRRVLSAFCFISYMQETFSFLDHQALKTLRQAISMAEVDCDPELLLSDLLVTVCILQRDGLRLTFVHRSFQEYFAALFAVQRSRTLNMFDFIQLLVARGKTDNVISFAHQLNEEAVEQEWVLPRIAELRSTVKEIPCNDSELVHAFFGLKSSDAILETASFKLVKLVLSLYNRGTPDFAPLLQQDHVLLTKYVDEQKELAERGETHNRGLIAADRQRAKGTSPIPLYFIPVPIRDQLLSIQAIAKAVRDLFDLQEELAGKQIVRASALEKLLKGL